MPVSAWRGENDATGAANIKDEMLLFRVGIRKFCHIITI